MNYLENRINSLLPEDSGTSMPFSELEGSNRDELVAEQAQAAQERKSAQELARIKTAAKRTIRQATAPTPSKPAPSPEKVEEARQALETIEAIEAEPAEPLSVEAVAQKTSASPALIQEALKLQGPSRKDINRLLASLNINTSVRLSKNDTANLLACLLTCNEAQLNAVMNNKKVPIVIKTVIKRLLADAQNGYMETINSLWDRIFGKTGLMLDLPEQTQMQTGIIPGVPVSREAYIVIRDTLLQ